MYPFIQLLHASVGISIKNTRHFPFTIKLVQMMNEYRDVFIPVSTHLLHYFLGSDDYVNKKTKPMKGSMPDMGVAIRISKEHYEKTEMKDWVFKSLVDEITIHLANNAH